MVETNSTNVPASASAERIYEGQEVYLTEHYYEDFKASVLEIPKYGWKVTRVVNAAATIQYQRRNLKLLMLLTVETSYLRKEA